MIVPDFGESAKSASMLALRDALDAIIPRCTFFLPTMGLSDLMDPTISETPKHSSEDSIEFKVRFISLPEAVTHPYEEVVADQYEEAVTDSYEKVATDPCEDEESKSREDKLIELSADRIRAELKHIMGTLSVLVMFGKSAMLVKDIPSRRKVLYINPEFSAEEPWRQQYIANKKSLDEYYDKYSSEKLHTYRQIPYIIGKGTEVFTKRKKQMYLGIITNSNNAGEFGRRYPDWVMVDKTLEGNAERLAKTIYDFAKEELRFPRTEIDDNVYHFPWKWYSDITGRDLCRFSTPLLLSEYPVYGFTVNEILSDGSSGLKLRVGEENIEIPSENIINRQDLEQLSDAIATLRKELPPSLPPQKRILVVHDYSTDNTNHIDEFCLTLRKYGYYVAKFIHGIPSEKERRSLERCCRRYPWDMIVTFRGACLLATGVANTHRLFINPEWAVWTRLSSLDKQALAAVRKMGETICIKTADNIMATSWFTSNNIESEIVTQHQKYFHSTTYVPTEPGVEKGMAKLAKMVHNYLTVLDID